jgi:putative N-acetylmannosamine-6-phosphate epimerase
MRTLVMGKRQTRIFKADLSKHRETLPGKEANVLLTNQTTLHGYIEKVESDALLLRDLRRKGHLLKFTDIEEIMLDRETAY